MDLGARYSDSHPLVKAAKNQLEEAKGVLATQAAERLETTDDINPIYRNLSMELKQQQGVVAGFKARQAELAEQKGVILAELRKLNNQDLQIDQLSREVDLARDKFLQYSRNMEEARIDKELETGGISNVSIVQPATFAEKPISPSKPVVGLATLLLAAASTISLIVAREPSSFGLSTGGLENGYESPAFESAPLRHDVQSKVNGRNVDEPIASST
jgi:uncharacterized protein involved in exopolysaccharide biosynthesis